MASKRPRSADEDWVDYARYVKAFKISHPHQCDGCNLWHDGRQHTCERCRLDFCGDCEFHVIRGNKRVEWCGECYKIETKDIDPAHLPTHRQSEESAAEIFAEIAMTMPMSWPLNKKLDALGRNLRLTHMSDATRRKIFRMLGMSLLRTIRKLVEKEADVENNYFDRISAPIIPDYAPRADRMEIVRAVRALKHVAGWTVEKHGQEWHVLTPYAAPPSKHSLSKPSPDCAQRHEMQCIAALCLLESRFHELDDSDDSDDSE